MIRTIMGVSGLLAFAITILGGVYAGNTFEFTLVRALQAMGVFCLIGAVLGWFAQIALREYQQQQADALAAKTEETTEPNPAEPATAGATGSVSSNPTP